MHIGDKPASATRTTIATFVAAMIVATAMAGCGGPDFEAVAQYKGFLEQAKPSLNKMNRVREDLFQLSDPDDVLPKFRDELLPVVKQLSQLAAEHPTPETSRLAEIHVTLRNVLRDYAESTAKLVERLQKIEADTEADPDKRDEARELAVIGWGEDDQKFGTHMETLAADLTRYLDDQMKN